MFKVGLNTTRYGKMMYLTTDMFFSCCLEQGHIFEEELVETFLSNIIKKSNTILDIGAHCGSHSIMYSSINPACEIFAFEPQKVIFDLLKCNIALNNLHDRVHAFNIALGNKHCSASMHNKCVDGDNTHIPLNNTHNFNFGGLQIGLGGDPIEIQTVDSLKFDKKIDFIKIDVEGFEDFVIDGALKTITKDRPVIFFEKNDKVKTVNMLGFYTETSKDIMQVLLELNYNIVPLPSANFLAVPLSTELESSSP